MFGTGYNARSMVDAFRADQTGQTDALIQLIAPGIEQAITPAVGQLVARDLQQNLPGEVVQLVPQIANAVTQDQVFVQGIQQMVQQQVPPQQAPPQQAQPQQAVVAPNAFKLSKVSRADQYGVIGGELSVREIFSTDPLLNDNGQLRDLDAFLNNFTADDMRHYYLMPNSATPYLRYAMSRYINSDGGPPVGPLPTGVRSTPGQKAGADPYDVNNLNTFSQSLFSTRTWNRDFPWQTPENFIDFRRLKLKNGYKVKGEKNSAVDTSNDVHVFYFTNENGRNDVREVPYDANYFILPNSWKLYARFPDGMLLYQSPKGVIQAEFPMGTFYQKSNPNIPRSDYQNNASHAAASQLARITALQISDDEKGSMMELAAYLGAMIVVKNKARIRGGGGGANHVTRNRRRHHNKSVKRNSKMTRAKGGRRAARVRAMSILKSAKRKFYKSGGLGIGYPTEGPKGGMYPFAKPIPQGGGQSSLCATDPANCNVNM